jgi:hypothetical protein
MFSISSEPSPASRIHRHGCVEVNQQDLDLGPGRPYRSIREDGAHLGSMMLDNGIEGVLSGVIEVQIRSSNLHQRRLDRVRGFPDEAIGKIDLNVIFVARHGVEVWRKLHIQDSRDRKPAAIGTISGSSL